MNKYTKIFNQELEKYGIKVKRYRPTMTGRAYIKDKTISCPLPKGKISLMVGLHEIGHCVNGQVKPRYYEEFLAEKWAIDTAKKYGVQVPRRWIRRSKKWVHYAIRKAINRKAKWSKLNKKACKWVKFTKKDYKNWVNDGFVYYHF